MESLTGWYFVVMLVFGLMWLPAIPALTALGFLLARRPRGALLWFASALLCEAILGAFLVLILPWSQAGWTFHPLEVVPALSILLAGSGQFLGALRGRKAYAIALACAVAAAVAAVVAATVWLDQRHVGWATLPVTVTSLALALGSLFAAAVVPVDRRTSEAEGIRAMEP